jgi:hypothetical protein
MSVTFRTVKGLLRRDYKRIIPMPVPGRIEFHRISLVPHNQLDGVSVLYIEKGYAWDHASGAFDTKSIIEGALVHDALCELMHNGKLTTSAWDRAAEIMYDINIGEPFPMMKMRAKWIRKAIKKVGPGVTKSRIWITI